MGHWNMINWTIKSGHKSSAAPHEDIGFKKYDYTIFSQTVIEYTTRKWSGIDWHYFYNIPESKHIQVNST